MNGGMAMLAALQVAALNWDALPPLPWRAPPLLTADMQGFVQREVKVRKCVLAKPKTLEVQVAILIDETGSVRTAVPRSINCPTVEQYAAALVAGFARNNLLPRPGASEQWYRTSLTFTWPQ